ncbi:MAG: dioxygenase [Methylococcaceae bacterium]|nr:dioxygenase [Methylococcaceae bacterium]
MASDESDNLSPVVFIPHGAGPLPLLGDKNHQEMIAFLQEITPSLGKPSAILVISAHWETAHPTITSGDFPSLIYDYSGFPKESYEIEYAVPGSPDLAKKIFKLLEKAGIEAKLDNQRGFDHGLFVPLKLMYPQANIPCVQLSLVKGLDPTEHIRIGKALSELRRENVLVIGSGFSFHNIQGFFASSSTEIRAMNNAFEKWLLDTCSNKSYSENERERRLINWENAPAARYCHPREEHLMPLHICYGITGTAAKQSFEINIMEKKASAYIW